jgi:hypothetical protein
MRAAPAPSARAARCNACAATATPGTAACGCLNPGRAGRSRCARAALAPPHERPPDVRASSRGFRGRPRRAATHGATPRWDGPCQSWGRVHQHRKRTLPLDFVTSEPPPGASILAAAKRTDGDKSGPRSWADRIFSGDSRVIGFSGSDGAQGGERSHLHVHADDGSGLLDRRRIFAPEAPVHPMGISFA